MAKLILFSGACNSGKTTTLKALASKLESLGEDAVILNELVRDEVKVPIDEIRKDPKAYLQLQNTVIRKKIEQEKAAIESIRPATYLADRAVTDSLFYLENYVDKSKLDKKDIELFISLHRYVLEYLDKYFWRYTLVVQFYPIATHEQDQMRPLFLDELKYYESECIIRLNSYYSCCYSHNNVLAVDLNYANTEEAVNRIINAVWKK